MYGLSGRGGQALDHPKLLQGRGLLDLFGLKQVPDHAMRTLGTAVDSVQPSRRGDVVHKDVGGAWVQFFMHNLTVVNHRDDRSLFAHQPQIGEHAPLQIKEPMPLAKSHAIDRNG